MNRTYEPKRNIMFRIHYRKVIQPSIISKIARLYNIAYWQKFLIKNSKEFETDFIISAIINFISPLSLKPFHIVRNNKEISFMATNCLEAILMLVSKGLKIEYPELKCSSENKNVEKLQKSLPLTKSLILLPTNVSLTKLASSKELEDLSRETYVGRSISDLVSGTLLDFYYETKGSNPTSRQKKCRNVYCRQYTFEHPYPYALGELETSSDHCIACITLDIIINAVQIKADMCLPNSVFKVLMKRRDNKEEGNFNLSAFHTDPDLEEFYPLYNSKKFVALLQNVKVLHPWKISLANNFIRKLGPLCLLKRENVISLDLQQNKISSLKDLEPLKHFTELRELNLSGNPICEKLSSSEYRTSIREIFPKLEVLDNINLCQGPETQHNFLCSQEAGDLAEQFLEYFFTVYDSVDRMQMSELYHENAMFSLTCNLIPAQNSNKSSRLIHYLSVNRNLLSPLIDTASKNKFLICGRENIMKLYQMLPISCHDPYKMETDIIYYTDNLAVLVIFGIFRETEQYCGFSRNFVLRCDNGQYCITNDQLHVYNALDEQVKQSFEKPQRINFTGVPIPFYQEQYKELQDVVRLTTGMNIEYSKRLMEEYHYDLKTALSVFIERHINNQIPQEAFQQEKYESQEKVKAQQVPSVEFIAKVKTQKLTFSDLTMYQMLTDERLAMIATRLKQEKETRNEQEAVKGNEEVKQNQHIMNVKMQGYEVTPHRKSFQRFCIPKSSKKLKTRKLTRNNLHYLK